MRKLTRIILRNMSPLHLGMGRDAYDTASNRLPSDSLSAALASVRALQGKHEDIEEFLRSFTISSAFPYCGNEFFLPRPCGRLPIRVKGMQEKEYRKDLKKIQYISSSLWHPMMKGDTIEIEPAQLHGEFLIAEPVADYKKPMTHVANQRVMVPRADDKDAVPFTFEWTFFLHGDIESGLYCIVDCEDSVRAEIIDLFKLLGSSGIGSDRTVGGGLFDVEVDEIDWQDISGKATMLLSTYIPQESEIELLNLTSSNYMLLKRGGFMSGSSNEKTRQLRRKTVYMFDTGSIFDTTHPFEGKIVNLAPEWNAEGMHPVFRCGRPLCVTVNMHYDEK